MVGMILEGDEWMDGGWEGGWGDGVVGCGLVLWEGWMWSRGELFGLVWPLLA